MSRRYKFSLGLIIAAVLFISFRNDSLPNDYREHYTTQTERMRVRQQVLLNGIASADVSTAAGKMKVRALIDSARLAMKQCDFWLRYLEPQTYKLINGPLPVEWETEVFEKFEKPYRKEGAGLTLAALYLDEAEVQKDTLMYLIRSSLAAAQVFAADSITEQLTSYHHFYLCNRLLLLNLAAIYTTGFECPDATRIMPELRAMLQGLQHTYAAANKSFPATPLPANYLALYDSMLAFVATQSDEQQLFDHFTFIRDYVNPLFTLNQKLILKYHVVSHSMLDYSLNKAAVSIFDKSLYKGQNAKGIFLRVNDSNALADIEHIGRLLFYDPILSGNNQRSCASCHKPTQYFTDTQFATSVHFNGTDRLARNSPSLVNAVYNHLLMLDGKHFTLQHQGQDVISNSNEMNCREADVLKKVLSCKQYKGAFKKMLEYTPQEPEVTMEHIVSAISLYYSKFSNYYAPFDRAMNRTATLDADAIAGFNLFMSKAQCATCHFVPQFNGVKPPYVGSEFEVLGVPADTLYSSLSADSGRYRVHPAAEMRNAFRTGSLRNASHTAPYMHNGVFRTLEQVVDFYDAGGGVGHGLHVPNQTLSSDSLNLTDAEKKSLIAFMKSLDEDIVFEPVPAQLPASGSRALNNRKSGGTY